MQINSHIGSIDAALQLCGLTEWRMFYNAAAEARVIVAWGDSAVLLCTRAPSNAPTLCTIARCVVFCMLCVDISGRQERLLAVFHSR